MLNTYIITKYIFTCQEEIIKINLVNDYCQQLRQITLSCLTCYAVNLYKIPVPLQFITWLQLPH